MDLSRRATGTARRRDRPPGRHRGHRGRARGARAPRPARIRRSPSSRCSNRSWATTVAPSSSCWRPCRSSCSSAARTCRACCWRGASAVAPSWRSGWHWAPADRASSACCWPKPSCWPRAARRSACWRPGRCSRSCCGWPVRHPPPGGGPRGRGRRSSSWPRPAGLAAIVTGLAPALGHHRADVQQALAADGERTTRAASDTRLHQLVVAAELAACLVLLVGALLFSRTLLRLQAVDLGFDPGQVVQHRGPRSDRSPRHTRPLAAAGGGCGRGVATRARDPRRDVRSGDERPAVHARGDRDRRHARGQRRHLAGALHRVSPRVLPDDGHDARTRPGLQRRRHERSRPPAGPAPRLAAAGSRDRQRDGGTDVWTEGEALGRALSTSFDARPVSRRDVVGIVRDARSASMRETAGRRSSSRTSKSIRPSR